MGRKGVIAKWNCSDVFVKVDAFFDLPFRTWTTTVLGLALEGLQVYFPESGALARCINK